MAKVKLASASIDERGKAHGGKAGDQTGKEVKIQSYYVNSKGWRVFRCKDARMAEMIAADAEAAAKNNNIGYDQHERQTLYEASKPYGFNAAMVKTPCECDCSSLVRVCCAYAGINLPASFRTSNEPKNLLASGYFEELKGEKYTESDNYLRRGDILCTATQGHTVVVITNGKDADVPPITTGKIKVTGNSVYVRSGAGKEYKALGIVHKGDLLPYGGETSNGWYLVEYKNSNAWISGKWSILI